MKLLPAELRQQLPPLYAQEHTRDPIVYAKFLTPSSSWTWYVTEGSAQYDPEDPAGGEGDFLFFGFVISFEKEWGYFSLNEMESAREVPRGRSQLSQLRRSAPSETGAALPSSTVARRTL